jgi:lipopolysaccharide transport system ATP-binding protein
MYVRLGFAVAAHLEPDILIVDEVLAVGDSEFQSKCIGKIKNISASDNRVVIFVSHNIPSIQKLCSNCLLMHNGSLVMQGSTNDVVTSYLASKTKFATYLFDGSHNSSAVIRKAWCENANAVPCNEVPLGAVWRIVLQVELLKSTKRFICGVGISRMDEISINTSWTTEEALSTGIYEFAFEQNKFQLAHGKYIIHLGLMEGKQVLQYVDNALGIDIVEVKAGLDSRVLDTGPESGFLLDQMPFSWRRLD